MLNKRKNIGNQSKGFLVGSIRVVMKCIDVYWGKTFVRVERKYYARGPARVDKNRSLWQNIVPSIVEPKHLPILSQIFMLFVEKVHCSHIYFLSIGKILFSHYSDQLTATTEQSRIILPLNLQSDVFGSNYF